MHASWPPNVAEEVEIGLEKRKFEAMTLGINARVLQNHILKSNKPKDCQRQAIFGSEN